MFFDRPIGRTFPNRVDSIVDFVSDRRFKIKKTFISHWHGVTTKKDAIIGAVEKILIDMGLIFEISSGKYSCMLDELKFAVELSRNVFSQAYGINIRSENKCKRIKEIEKFIKKKLKEITWQDTLLSINNSSN